uniref:Uncharacterized protein n=1 Tax=Salix viminalis TaxID=40686 RepID=A0A6N2K7S5_SALVM
MGKNQAYKAMQRSRLGTSSSGPEEIEDGCLYFSYCSLNSHGVAGGCSFHYRVHAARLASLNKSHTVTWEEFKKKQKEDEMRKGELEADKDRMMREYRAQLDAERAHKLAHGRNHSGSNSIHKKDRKDRDLKKRGSKKRKHLRRRSDDSSSSSSSSDSSSSEDERELKRSKSRSRKTKRSASQEPNTPVVMMKRLTKLA